MKTFSDKETEEIWSQAKLCYKKKKTKENLGDKEK